MKKLLLAVVCMWMVSGCMTFHQKPDKFQVYPEVMKTFQSDKSIAVIVPQNAPEMLLENLNSFAGKAGTMYYDMNEVYKIAQEHITDTLKNNYVPVSSSSSKWIKFTVTKMQWESWWVAGCYLYINIETSSGYKRDYRVQDQSATHLDRAVGGAISRAVEVMFQDSKIIEFIEKN